MGISKPGSDSGSSHVCWPNGCETHCEKVSTGKRWLRMCGCSSSPARWHVWTRRGCRPVSQYLYSVKPGRLECSRSEGSGRPFLLRRPAGRAGEETRRWPLLPPDDRCTAGRVADWSCSIPVTAKQKREITMVLYSFTACFFSFTAKTPTLLSFPPEARCWWSGDHFRPHTSCLCPWRRLSTGGGVLTSLCRITLSRLPDDSCSPFQARAPGEMKKIVRQKAWQLLKLQNNKLQSRTKRANKASYMTQTHACWMSLETGQLSPSGCIPNLHESLMCPYSHQTSLREKIDFYTFWRKCERPMSLLYLYSTLMGKIRKATVY